MVAIGHAFWYYIVVSFTFKIAFSLIPQKEGPTKQLDMKGVLNLDTITYGKLIPSEKFTFVTLVFSKASIGDYGTDSIRSDFYAFAKKAQTEGEAKNIIFSQIMVNGADNLKLATSLGLKKDFKHPELFLFTKGSRVPIPFPKTQSFRLYELVVFVSKHSDFYLKQAGRTKLLNGLREKFFSSISSDERDQVLASGKEDIKLLPEIEKVDAEYHWGILDKMNKQGYQFIRDEAESLRALVAESQGGERRLYELRLDVVQEILERINSREL